MRTILKNGLYLLSFFILVSLMASCLGNDNPEETVPLTDAELLSFGLSSDSVSGLASVVFTIDQRNGSIYNYDSMAYLTKIKDKVIVTYSSGAGVTNNVLNITGGDSIWVKSGDSIDISQPLTLKAFALDGKTVKQYNVQLNIHQVDPDSMQYYRIASELPFLQTEDTKTVSFNNRFLTYSRIDNQIQLNSSTDAVNWTPEGVSGLPENAVIREIQSIGNRLFAYTEDGDLYVRDNLTDDQWIKPDKPASIKIKSILGYLNADSKQPEGLSLIIETNGIYTFAFTEDFIDWEYDSTPIPDDFPVSGFSNYCYQLMYTSRITVFGGVSLNGTVQNAVWSTENGRYWAKLTGNTGVFPPLEGANIFYYNNEFWLINGKADDIYNKDIYYSTDGGVTWKTRPEKCLAPEDYPLRSNASLVTDKDNKYFYIIGGKQTTVLPDVWKGFLNKMEFEH
ncbi:MAG: DUF6242 domain-containing protein [Candidatus Azobacteroides sp.]|nr:DUF6242 domain-containing protein [Candidatus Azobacteroides sp.]